MDEDAKPGMPLPAPSPSSNCLAATAGPAAATRGQLAGTHRALARVRGGAGRPHLAAEHAVLDWTPEGGVQLRLLPSLQWRRDGRRGCLKPEEPVAVAASQD